MAQLPHADRRTTVLLPALVAAAVSAVITVSGVFLLGAPRVSLGPAAPVISQHQAAVQSGRIWQAQREQQSIHTIRFNRMRAAAVQSGIDWELRYRQMYPNR
jgi:hypothetical protein